MSDWGFGKAAGDRDGEEAGEGALDLSFSRLWPEEGTVVGVAFGVGRMRLSGKLE